MSRSVTLGALALAVTAAAIVAALVAFGSGEAEEGRVASKPRSEQPNIVLITTDDQTLASVNERTMPNTVELLGERGTTFTNAIVTTPLCCPSRASMLTGQYGHNNGVLSNAYKALDDKDNVLPAWLQRAGYRTAHVGKFLNGYEKRVDPPTTVAPGWDQWFTEFRPRGYYDYDLSENGEKVHYGSEDGDYLTRVLNEEAVRLVREHGDAAEPLYLQLDHKAPHTGKGSRTRRCRDQAAVPGPDDEDLFRDEPLPRPPSFNERDVRDKPSFITSLPSLERETIEITEERYGCALASLREVDRGIGDLHRALREEGVLDDTVIVFVSDNGYFFGEHRLRAAKRHSYEEAVHVPLLIRVPRALRGGGPRVARVEEPVANIDLPPTFLQLAGASPCRAADDCRVMDGRSLMPLLRGRPRAWPPDRALLIELEVGNKPSEPGRICKYEGVRVGDLSYTDYELVQDPATGECEPSEDVELYDLSEDPFQLENLAANGRIPPAEGERLQGLVARLGDCTGIEGRDPAPPEGRSYCD